MGEINIEHIKGGFTIKWFRLFILKILYEGTAVTEKAPDLMQGSSAVKVRCLYDT